MFAGRAANALSEVQHAIYIPDLLEVNKMPMNPKRGLARLGVAVQEGVSRARSRASSLKTPVGDRTSSRSRSRPAAQEPTAAEISARYTTMGNVLQPDERRQRAMHGLAVSYILLYRHEYRVMSSVIEKWVNDYVPLDIKHIWLETASNMDLWLFRPPEQTIERPELHFKVGEIFNKYYLSSEEQRSDCRSICRDLLAVALKALGRRAPGKTVLREICTGIESGERIPDSPEDSGTEAEDIASAMNSINIQA